MTIKKLVCIFILISCTDAVIAEPIKIVISQTPNACIVVGSKPKTDELYAAEQLQKYIKKISKATLPIVDKLPGGDKPFICIGDADCGVDIDLNLTQEESESGAFLLRTLDNGLLIRGGLSNGTLYGVYAFLEDLGCRFYAPGDEGEVIPAMTDITVGATNRLEKPSFIYRDFVFYAGWDFLSLQVKKDFVEWKAKLRLGGPVERYNEGYGFDFLMPSDKYFDEHPEWYALRFGKRSRLKHEVYLCVSNMEMRKQFAKNVIQWFKDHPENISCSISPHDGAPACDCQNCAKLDDPRYPGDLTRRMLHFANEITEAVTKVYPDKYLQCYLPYVNMYHMPADIKPHPRFVPEYVDVRGNPNRTWDDPSRGEEKRALSEWAKTGNRILLHGWLHLSPVDWPQAYTMAKNMEFLHESGAVGFWCGMGGYSPSLKISMYTISKKLWNIKTDVSSTIDEYYSRYYGPAAEYIKTYHKLLEKSWYNCHDEGGGGAHKAYLAFAPEHTAIYEKYMAKAQVSVADSDDVFKRRVAEAQLAFNVGKDLGQVVSDTVDAVMTRKLEDRKAAAESMGRAIAFLKSIDHLDIVDESLLTGFYYVSFADAISNPKPRTIPGLSPPLKGTLGPDYRQGHYSYYYDTMHNGPQHTRDTLSMKGGLKTTFHSISIEPESEGERIFEFAAAAGKVFKEVRIKYIGLNHEGQLPASRAEISTDQGKTYTLLVENPVQSFYKDLTEQVSGKVSFLIRHWGKNDSKKEIQFGLNPIIEWTEQDAPEGTVRTLLTTEYLKTQPEIPIDPSKYTFENIPSLRIPDRTVLFRNKMDLEIWRNFQPHIKTYRHILKVDKSAGAGDSESLHCSTAEDPAENTFVYLYLLPGKTYKVSFDIRIDRGTVKASAQTDGYRSDVLKIPENKEFKSFSYTIKTPKTNKDFVKFKIDFATETDKSSFRLDNVVVELSGKK